MSMKKNTQDSDIVRKGFPSDEAWYGYVVFVAVTIIAITCALPLGVFGIIYGKWLSTIGDETTGTSIANGMFNTIMCFTGLATNILLNTWSCRTVGTIGAIICVIGSFSVVFVNDLISFIFLYSVIQGMGYGLLFPASLTALNNVFDKKLSFMMGASQALMVACCILMPQCAKFIMDNYGFRVSVLVLGGVTLLNVPAAIVLTRFQCCDKKSNQDNVFVSIKSKSTTDLVINVSVEPLLKKRHSLRKASIQGDFKILQIADRAASVVSMNRDKRKLDNNNDEKLEVEDEKESIWVSVKSSMDMSLLTVPKYLNITIGISLSSTSDIFFITIMPVVLTDLGFNQSEIALTMSLFFGSDLVSRTLLSVVMSCTHIKSRYWILGGTIFSTLVRVAFLLCKEHLAKISTLVVLGFSRSFIQTPPPLVIAEEYPDGFATAFSLYMVVTGVTSLIVGPLMGVVKTLTGSTEMVCHLLTGCNVICVISWVCEIAIGFRKSKDTKECVRHDNV
ncbi:unnamed protein product [Ceutorhynchus assimilis]|uniref:Uncharacterized protein n=1 Tax=Ceutorhynchus assimilis TaxID=467358 RepID=A0A9N9QLS5_9CUCU|nr:unnamed protein product [Ceutorhynchus assimilis]